MCVVARVVCISARLMAVVKCKKYERIYIIVVVVVAYAATTTSSPSFKLMADARASGTPHAGDAKNEHKNLSLFAYASSTSSSVSFLFLVLRARAVMRFGPHQWLTCFGPGLKCAMSFGGTPKT